MKKSMLIAATTVACLSTLCATLARADDSARPLTREEVVAQTLAARQSGELAVLNAGGTWTPAAAPAPLTREEVVAQTLAARQSGELAVLNAGGSWTAKTAEAPKTRDEVIHEFMLSHQSSDSLALEHSL